MTEKVFYAVLMVLVVVVYGWLVINDAKQTDREQTHCRIIESLGGLDRSPDCQKYFH